MTAEEIVVLAHKMRVRAQDRGQTMAGTELFAWKCTVTKGGVSRIYWMVTYTCLSTLMVIEHADSNFQGPGYHRTTASYYGTLDMDTLDTFTRRQMTGVLTRNGRAFYVHSKLYSHVTPGAPIVKRHGT